MFGQRVKESINGCIRSSSPQKLDCSRANPESKQDLLHPRGGHDAAMLGSASDVDCATIVMTFHVMRERDIVK